MSFFADVEKVTPIEIFALNEAANADKHPSKVNLSVGSYRTNEGRPWVLPVVRKVEALLESDETLDHEYLPILGLDEFSKAATELLLGADNPAVIDGRAVGAQAVSGTGALFIGAMFLRKLLGFTTYYCSRPAYANHKLTFDMAGFTEGRSYRYWNPKTRSLDFDGMCEDLKAAPPNSIIVLQVCAHNPTGVDPTQQQWKQIADIVRKKRLFPFFDSAYQGFASGDLERDALPVRMFVNEGFEMLCAQSFSKNLGLYDERVGNLTMVLSDPMLLPAVLSRMTHVSCGVHGNPPAHGARIAAAILTSKYLLEEWKHDIRTMSGRIVSMRVVLRDRLVRLGTPGTWDHITSQIGMFSYSGLTPEQCEYLTNERHIYLLRSGRINMAGLTTANIDNVAAAIHEAVTKLPPPPQ